jgi:hypothetical protein
MNQELATMTTHEKEQFRGSEASLSSATVDGMRVIDRLPYLAVLMEPGERDPRKVPQWFSANQITCPRCGRTDYGNVDPSKVVMCSLCLMAEATKAERVGVVSVWRNPGNHKAAPETPRMRLRLKSNRPSKVRTCERCGESFRGRSNAQRFCEDCQKGARNDRQRKLMAGRRKAESVVSV